VGQGGISVDHATTLITGACTTTAKREAYGILPITYSLARKSAGRDLRILNWIKGGLLKKSTLVGVKRQGFVSSFLEMGIDDLISSHHQ
jgi:hypothetical protein